MSTTVPKLTTRELIEAFLRTQIESVGAKTGLYDAGFSYVVVRRSNDFG